MRTAFSHEALRRKDSGCLTHHSRVSFNCGGKAHGFVGHSLLFAKANGFFSGFVGGKFNSPGITNVWHVDRWAT